MQGEQEPVEDARRIPVGVQVSEEEVGVIGEGIQKQMYLVYVAEGAVGVGEAEETEIAKMTGEYLPPEEAPLAEEMRNVVT